MNYVIIELSNYIIMAILGAYLLSSIWPLFTNNKRRIKGVYVRQCLYILLFHTVGMSTLYFVNDDPKYIYLFLGQLFVTLIINRLSCLLYEKINRLLINHMCILLTFSFIILARLNFGKAFRQLIIIAISLIFYMIIPAIFKKMNKLYNATSFFGILGIILLMIVLGFGKTVNGSKLSLNFGLFSFQSSEFVKILFVLFIAGLLYSNKRLGRVFTTFLVSCVFIGLLALSRDLGSALIFYVTLLVIIYFATGNLLYPIIGTGGGIIAALIGYHSFAHVQVRISVWLDPWKDINNTGYQLAQSLFGIGTGNWYGMGIGRGNPNTIPFVDEDFAYSAICEEMGAISGILLLLIYLLIFILMIKISLKAKNEYNKLIGIGLSTIFILQVILTVGGGTKFIPLTGLTLPLISNGGSSLMSIFIMFGILQGVAIASKNNSKIGDLDMHPSDNNISDNNEYIYDDNYEYEDYSDDEYYENEYIDDYPDEKTSEWKYRILHNSDRFKFGLLIAINCVLFVLIIINIAKFLINDRETILNSSFNYKRQEILASENYRGNIYASDGELLATTVVEGGKEIRKYPMGRLFAHAIGYSTFGKTGIENTMNINLITSDIGVDDKIKNDIEGVKNPGNNIYTTLDPKLQQVAYDALGVYNGAIIVQEAKTGKILVMVSKPDYDPNEILEKWDEISNDTKNSPLLNRATQGLYPPGSTFKIMTALEYIRQYPDSYMNYYYSCNGHYTLGSDSINCYHKMVHGGVDFTQSFAKSCNSSFANIGTKLNRKEFAKSLEELLFNENLPVSFESKASHISMRENMSNEEIIQSAIGQSDTLMTPLHLNMITASIANNGVMMKPYMVEKIKNANGKVIKNYKPSEYGRVISKDEAAILREMMEEVVLSGTAKKLSGQNYTAAGKTGSAEYGNIKGQSHAWFTGYAPSDNPEIVVTVIIEGGGSGGDYSAPVARRIFSSYFEE